MTASGLSNQRSPHPPVDRGAWAMLISLTVIGFAVIGGTLTSLAVYLPVLQAAFGWSEAEMGGGAVMLLLGMSLANLAAGRLEQRIGLRALLAVGIVATAAGWGATTVVSDLSQFMAAMAVAGAGAALATIVPGVAAITQVFETRRGMALAVFIGGLALASSIVPPISEQLIEGLGWRNAFLVSGSAVALICLPLTLLTPGSTPSRTSERPDIDATAETGPSAAEASRFPAFWLLLVGLTFSQLCMNGVLFNLVAMLVKSGYSHEGAVTFYSIANLASLPGLFAGGFLADRYGARTVLPGAIALQAAGSLCLLWIGGGSVVQIAAMAGFAMMWGLVAGLPAQVGSMLLADTVGMTAFPTLLGVIFAVSGLVGALAPLMMGLLYGIGNSYALPIFACAVLTALAAAMILLVRPRRA